MRRRQVSVIGAAKADPELRALALELGQALVDAGYRIVCGGLTGVMEAVSEGAHRSERAAGADVVGILPTIEADAANPYVDIVVPTGLGHARNVLIVASGDAVVAVGGRTGTLSEIAVAWTLGKPLVALSPAGGWGARLAGEHLDDRRSDAIVDAASVADVIAALDQALPPAERASLPR